jgi:hypothetical protein
VTAPPTPLPEPDGGHCRAELGGLIHPAGARLCPCAGFRWVAPDGPQVGSYREPPQR